MTTLWVLTGVAWLTGWIFLWRVPVCARDPRRTQYPKISVIIPARNEAANLTALLPSLNAQDLKPEEVWVVDDGSEDATAEVARRHGARVLTAGPLPAGWLGKPWACQQGADAAHGEILCFLDADCILEAGGFRKLLDTFLLRPGVLSVSPFHKMKTWPEQFSAFFNIMQAAGLNAFTFFGEKIRPAGLFGPCLVIHRSDYLRAGGHAAVKHKVLENFSLAGPLAAAGVPLHLFGGRDVLSVRLYPNGLDELIRGWAKSLAKGAGSTPLLTLLATIFWIAGQIMTTANLLQNAILGPVPALAAWSAVYILFALQCRRHLTQLGNFRSWVSLLFPIHLLFFLAVFAWSAAMGKRGLTWKGRTVGGE